MPGTGGADWLDSRFRGNGGKYLLAALDRQRGRRQGAESMSALTVIFACAFYAGILVLVGGLGYRIAGYARTPVPLRIPTTPAPLTKGGAAFRVAREVVLFESLFRSNKWTWIFAALFHAGMALALLRHLRYFLEPVWGWVAWMQPFGVYGGMPDGCRIALIGLPDDNGVRLNDGRPGAALGPAALRGALACYGTPFDSATGLALQTRVFDAGDVAPAEGEGEEALHATHERVTEALAAVHDLGLVPVCIGGGHDLTFPAVRALSNHDGRPVGGVNVDPHLDVRDSAGSGMPYRRLIDEGCLEPTRFVEHSAGRFTNSEAHAAWLRLKGATITTIDEVLADEAAAIEASLAAALPRSAGDAPAFLSIDLDAIDASQAPGVCSPCPMGLSVAHVVEMTRRAGAHSGVRHLDLMELCPPHDEDGRTARVAALLVLTFVAALGGRDS